MRTQFTPLGTLRHRRGDGEESHYLRAMTAVAGVASDFHLEPETVWLAHDIGSLQAERGDFNSSERLAASLLVLLVMYAQRQGSTRLPLVFDEDGYICGVLRDLAEQVGEADDDETRATTDLLRDVVDIASTMEALLTDGRMDHIVGRPGDYRPLLRESEHLYIEKIHHQEESLVGALAGRLQSVEPEGSDEHAPKAEVVKAVSEVLDHSPYGPTTDPIERERRTELLQAVVDSRMTVISGGPGTGKTSIIVAISRTLVRLGIEPDELAFAAPTGKAAKRMRESMEDQFSRLGDDLYAADAALKDALAESIEPKTLHRLLSYSPYFDAFQRDADNPLEHRAVIVDEASMIDISLMDSLLAAVEPKTLLILVGDADQLPSVGAGAVFADLTATEAVTSHRLEKNYRTEGEEILAAARTINAGEVPQVEKVHTLDHLGQPRDTASKEPEGIWRLERPGESAFADFVDAWHKRFVDVRTLFGDPSELSPQDLPYRRQKLQSPFVERLPQDGGGFTNAAFELLEQIFGHFAKSRLLCLTRVRKHGANRVNRMMHRRFKELHRLRNPARFHAGEPVMMLGNDYELDLFNGDQGVVLYTRFNQRDEDGEPTDFANKRVVFPARGGGYRSVDLDRIRERIELSYAMTVHKSQGSEFGHIALALPDEHIPLSTREIFYTGVTRAKHSVTLFGTEDRIAEAVENPTRRFTGVGEKLAARHREATHPQESTGVDAEPSVEA